MNFINHEPLNFRSNFRYKSVKCRGVDYVKYDL